MKEAPDDEEDNGETMAFQPLFAPDGNTAGLEMKVSLRDLDASAHPLIPGKLSKGIHPSGPPDDLPGPMTAGKGGSTPQREVRTARIWPARERKRAGLWDAFLDWMKRWRIWS